MGVVIINNNKQQKIGNNVNVTVFNRIINNIYFTISSDVSPHMIQTIIITMYLSIVVDFINIDGGDNDT